MSKQNPAPEEPAPALAETADKESSNTAPAQEPPVYANQPEQPISEPAPRVDDEDCALSYAGLRRFLGLIIGLAAFYYITREIASVLIMFTVVTLTAFVLNPVVVWLEQRGLKRGLAVLTVILGLIGTLVLCGWLIVPPIMQEVNNLAAQMPKYAANIREQAGQLAERYPALERVLPEFDRLQGGFNLQPAQIGTWLTRILTYTQGIVGAVFGSIIGLLLLVFTLSNPQPLVSGFLSAVPARHREPAGRSLARIQQQMTAWAKATLINGLITGISTGLLLYFIGVGPALVFGVLAFFGEFVPNIGPIVTSIPALFVALGMGPGKFAAAVAVILFVQQVESNLLVPFIMGRSMELHPVTIVFFALAMGAMLGAVGAILAVPMAAIAKVLFDEFYLRPQRVPEGEIEARAKDLIAGKPWPGQELK